MSENKNNSETRKISRLLNLLLILNFILMVICLTRIKISYGEEKNYNALASSYKDDYIKKNEDIIGSITIANRTFLLAQTDNNTFYLNHDYDRQDDRFGAIFVDYRCSLLDDTNCYIYGHSSAKYDLPFNILFQFQDASFRESHKLVTINYRGFDLTYEILKVTNNYNNLDKYLYIQTCDEIAEGDIILVAKKV